MDETMLESINKIINYLQNCYNTDDISIEESKLINTKVEEMLFDAYISIRCTDYVFLKYGAFNVSSFFKDYRKEFSKETIVYISKFKLYKYINNRFNLRNIIILETLKEVIK